MTYCTTIDEVIVVNQIGKPADAYNDYYDAFLEALPANECRYGVLYLDDVMDHQGIKKRELVFYGWYVLMKHYEMYISRENVDYIGDNDQGTGSVSC